MGSEQKSRSLSLSVPTAIRKLAWTVVQPLVGLAVLSGCAYEVVTGQAMGTTYAITANCPDRLPTAAVAALLERIDARMSTYDGASELMRFNRGPVGDWVPVSRELVEVVAAAKQVAEHTGGALDPTVAPLVALWGFGVGARREAPDDALVSAARRLVGHRHVRYRRAPPALMKDRVLSMDLSAIAKGHAVDRMADTLRAAGCRAFLVEFGGEITAHGPAPSGGPWRIGIDSPSGAGRIDEAITLRDAGLATSGDYRQYTERDGRRDAHIIDPRSGYPVRHRLASVTVVAESARLADAYATALMVLGEHAGRRFADDAGLAALFIVRTEAGFETLRSEAMERRRS